MVTVLSVPAGASLTAVTLTVIVFARRIEIDAAVGGAAVVLHLEREAGVAVPLALAAGVKTSMPAGDVGDADELAGRDRHAVVGQRAGAGQAW